LESQGEPFEIEPEEVKGKRKRLVRTRVKSEKSEKTNVAALEDEDDDNEPLKIKKRKISKQLKIKKNVESSTIATSGTLTDPKGPVALTQDIQHPTNSNQPSESSLEFLKQHLVGELPPQTNSPSNQIISEITQPETSEMIQLEHDQPQPEPYISPEHVLSQIAPQPFPEQTKSQLEGEPNQTSILPTKDQVDEMIKELTHV